MMPRGVEHEYTGAKLIDQVMDDQYDQSYDAERR